MDATSIKQVAEYLPARLRLGVRFLVPTTVMTVGKALRLDLLPESFLDSFPFPK